MKNKLVAPLLKWVGGKRQSLHSLKDIYKFEKELQIKNFLKPTILEEP